MRTFPEDYRWGNEVSRSTPPRVRRPPLSQSQLQQAWSTPPPMEAPEDMPNPLSKKDMPAPTLKKKQQTTKKLASPAVGRTLPKVSAARRRAIVREQPRDQQGRFASTGQAIMRGVRNMFRPAPLVPTSLSKKRPQAPAPAGKQKKPPVLERGVVGRARAVANGDYGRFQKRNARKNATAQIGELGKRPVRRKRRSLPQAAQPVRPRKKKRGWLRRWLFG